MMGYALSRKDLGRSPELTDGLHTGDLGYLDERGYLRLTGRTNRFAKIHGVRVSLDEVESLLGLDRPVAAIARGDNRVLVLVESPEDLELEAVRDTLADALRVSPASIEVRAIPSIPTKTNGKTDYSKLSEFA
jgi:acyl-CoA synthetase (AMP-forming)/AMP-acid ligase II